MILIKRWKKPVLNILKISYTRILSFWLEKIGKCILWGYIKHPYKKFPNGISDNSYLQDKLYNCILSAIFIKIEVNTKKCIITSSSTGNMWWLPSNWHKTAAWRIGQTKNTLSFLGWNCTLRIGVGNLNLSSHSPVKTSQIHTLLSVEALKSFCPYLDQL